MSSPQTFQVATCRRNNAAVIERVSHTYIGMMLAFLALIRATPFFIVSNISTKMAGGGGGGDFVAGDAVDGFTLKPA